MHKIIFIHGLLGSKNNFTYLEQTFPEYNTTSIDLIGFGNEIKPSIKYDVNDFIISLEQKLNLGNHSDTPYILVGHSLGALLAKELTVKYPDRVIKSFLISYPFLEKSEALRAYSFFDRKYAEGTWWTKMLCRSEIFYQWLFYPFIYLFKFKYRQSYIDAFKHTYQSAHGAIENTIFKDNKEKLHRIAGKIILINGELDRSVDFAFSNHFNHYMIPEMGHPFFGYEHQISEIIKSNIQS